MDNRYQALGPSKAPIHNGMMNNIVATDVTFVDKTRVASHHGLFTSKTSGFAHVAHNSHHRSLSQGASCS